MTIMMPRLIICLMLLLAGTTTAFVVSPTAVTTPRLQKKRPSIVPLAERKDASRSGTKRERLDRLADLEDQRLSTDKGLVVKAAGAFVGLLVILLAVAFATVDGPI